MDMLGGPNGTSLAQSAEPTGSGPGSSIREPHRLATPEAASKLLRPSLLLKLFEERQAEELIESAVGRPRNPLMERPLERLFQYFAAEIADAHPHSDPEDSELRLEWLQGQLEADAGEELLGVVLRAWSFGKLAWPDDEYLSVHNVIGLLREQVHDEDEAGIAASSLLLEKALRKYAEDAPSAEAAAMHFVIRTTDVGPAFPTVLEAGRRAGLEIDAIVARLQTVITQADAREVGPAARFPVPGTNLAETARTFDLSAHMASARTMSVLDQVLVRQALATAVGTDGALSLQQLYGLIDEVVRLNPNRHQTYHAQGFVDAICGKPIRMQFPAANDERRVWVLCGALLGTLRDNDLDAVQRLLDEHAAVFDVLLAKPELYAGAWLLEPLYAFLRDERRFEALKKLFDAHLENLSRSQQKRMVGRAMTDARDLILAGKSDRAVDLLDAIWPTLGTPNNLAIAAIEQAGFQAQAIWRRGQAAMAQGDFDRALEFLNTLLRHYDLSPAMEAKVLADIGLAKAQIRRIHDVFPGADKATSDNVLASLGKGLEEFLKAAELDSHAAVRSRLCVAVLASDSRSTPDAISHFRAFLQATMNEKPGYYGEHAQAWTRFLLALAIMEAGERSDYQNAVDELDDALRVPGFVPPAYMCARLADAFAQAGFNESADSLLAVVEQKDPLALPQMVVDRRLEGCSARGRDCLLAYAQRPGLPVGERLTLLSRVLHAATQNNDGNALTHLAAAVQDLGEADLANCAQYVDLAEACRKQVTDESLIEAFEETQVALWKASGRYEPVFARLSRLVEELLDSGGAYDLEYAAEILDDLEALPAAWIRDKVAPLRQRLSAATAPPGKESLVEVLARRSSPVRIYVVGGGDRHRGYEASIKQWLPERFPPGKVDVEFLFPGFSANWMPHVDTVKRNIARFDAVVLIYATRTKFGEWVRELARGADIPAYTCGRQGRGAVMHQIAKGVAQAVA